MLSYHSQNLPRLHQIPTDVAGGCNFMLVGRDEGLAVSPLAPRSPV